MKFLIAFSLLVTVTLASKIEFQKFKTDFAKIYANELEEQERYNIFVQNLKEIDEHNSNVENTWIKGVNEFSDMTNMEFEATLGYTKIPPTNGIPMAKKRKIDLDSLPKNVDWSEKGATTPIKAQGHCGSCWAFATVEQLESYAFIANGTLPTLSTQQITSCVKNPYNCGGSGGCEGSVTELGFNYAQMYGIVEEKDYPYISGNTNDTEKCIYDPLKTPPTVGLSGYEKLPINDYASVMDHLANVGPLAVAIYATPLKDYVGGVFDGCPNDQNIDINHAVQLVGYGTDEKLGDYWKIRNSWGTKRGENGFYRIKRRSESYCGTNATPSHGLKCDGDGVLTQRVCGTCGILFDSVYPINVYFN